MAPPCEEEHIIMYITKYHTKSSLREDIAPFPLEIIHSRREFVL